jgi:hypothetical protein
MIAFVMEIKKQKGSVDPPVMCSEERALSDIERIAAWELLHDCLHYGSNEARPLMFDQSKLIVLVSKLLNKTNSKK